MVEGLGNEGSCMVRRSEMGRLGFVRISKASQPRAEGDLSQNTIY